MTGDTIFELVKLLITGAAGGAVVAWVNWGIKKRQQRLDYRHELIKSWRKLISSTQANYRHTQSTSDPDVTFAEIIERSSDYFSLKPHLSQKAIDALKDEKIEEGIVLVTGGRKTEINPCDQIVALLVDEVARIEAEWDLV